MSDDTRHLFHHATTGKPLYWNDCPLRWATVEELKAIWSKPVIVIGPEVQPGDRFIGEAQSAPTSWAQPFNNTVLEAHVIRRRADGLEDHFYVNTEGYRYACYAFKLANPLGNQQEAASTAHRSV